MTTIIQGNKEMLKEYKYFECGRCGWAGRADKDEYSFWDNYQDAHYYMSCPCCHVNIREVGKERKKELMKMIPQDYWGSR